eukprot:571345_1
MNWFCIGKEAQLKTVLSDMAKKIIEYTLSNKLESEQTYSWHPYAEALIRSYFKGQSEVYFNWNIINVDQCKWLTNILCDYESRSVKWDVVVTLFPRMNRLQIYNAPISMIVFFTL